MGRARDARGTRNQAGRSAGGVFAASRLVDPVISRVCGKYANLFEYIGKVFEHIGK